MSLNNSLQNVQAWTPATAENTTPLSFADQCQAAIEAIKVTMRQVSVTCISSSYGKDSSAVLALALEATRQLKEAGENPVVRILTTDTLVENPSQSKLNATMSKRAIDYARDHNLDVEQIWMTPDPSVHHLVWMLGGRGTASMAGQDNVCSKTMKLEPADKMRRLLAKTYGKENIATLTGLRHAESTVRSQSMKSRNESATTPFRNDAGGLQLAPIADWQEADVWRLINGAKRQIGFTTLDFSPTVLFYELTGEATCGSVSIAQTAKTAQSPCTSGRGGCWTCMKVDADHSLENMLDTHPHYAPLVRLAKAIRAGHWVPENRSFMAKTVDDQGRIRSFSNSYSISWTSQLMKWVMSIDATEDDYVEARSAKLGRTVERRFPRLLETEHELLIAFSWSRYGIQKPGEYARIREAIMQGKRWALPTDEELAALNAKADKKLMGKTVGYLQTSAMQSKTAYRDHWRDLVGTDTGCAPTSMLTGDGDRAMYKNSTGVIHDTLTVGDKIECDLTEMSTIEKEDFLWWYALEFAAGNKTHNEELNFFIRNGIIRARNGYQSTLADYVAFNHVLDDLRAQGPIDTLEAIEAHPAFTSNAESDQRPATPALIATSNQPAIDNTATAVNDSDTDDEPGQMSLMFA